MALLYYCSSTCERPPFNISNAVETTQELAPLAMSLKERHGPERGLGMPSSLTKYCAALSSTWSIIHLFLKTSPIIGVRQLCLYQYNISGSNTCARADGLRASEHFMWYYYISLGLPSAGKIGVKANKLCAAHTLASEQKHVISISSPSMLQYSSYVARIQLAPGLASARAQ